MKQKNNHSTTSISSGFTTIELVVVIGIIAILTALAIPSYNTWRQNLAYRDTARNVLSLLRQARSTAIASNTQQNVFLNATNQTAYVNGKSAVYNYLKTQVTSSPSVTVSFSSIGAVVSGTTSTIFIIDSSNRNRFYVQVDATGRVFIKGPL